jgi:hypothetical protein
MIDFNSADISENKLLDNFGEKIFQLLLRDFSSFDAYQSSLKDRKESDGHEDDFHITWATDMYSKRGIGYCEKDQISISSVTRRHYRIIRPRAEKSKEEQRFICLQPSLCLTTKEAFSGSVKGLNTSHSMVSPYIR